jgi:hypothetical protein
VYVSEFVCLLIENLLRAIFLPTHTEQSQVLTPVSQVVNPDYIPSHRLIYICRKRAKDCTSQVSGREVACNVRRRKFDEDLLAPKLWTVLQAKGCINAVFVSPVVDIRQKKSWNCLRREKESKVDAISKGCGEEAMRLKLVRVALEFV